MEHDELYNLIAEMALNDFKNCTPEQMEKLRQYKIEHPNKVLTEEEIKERNKILENTFKTIKEDKREPNVIDMEIKAKIRKEIEERSKK